MASTKKMGVFFQFRTPSGPMCVVVVVDITVSFIIWIFVTTLRSYEFEVDNPVDGKDIKEEETMEVVDIRMYHFSAEIVHL